MRIAVLGTKGIPAQFGGIERHCEELYPRLAERGHAVTLFVRGWYTPVRGPYRGVNLRLAPTLNHKGLDAFLHTAAGSFLTLADKFDIVHYHGIGPSLFSFMPELRRTQTVATVHALDWQRAKWGKGAQAVLRAGEWASAHFPGRTIVVSRELQNYFLAKYGRQTTFIPNGVTFTPRPRAAALLTPLGIKRGRYILFLGRLVPEKGCHDLIRAYRQLDTGLPLVVAGGSSHSDEYVQSLKTLAAGDGHIVFTGNVEGELLRQLSAHAALFVLPSLLEGFPIVLLEMLSFAVPILAADIGPSREALAGGEYGGLYRAGDVEDLQLRLGEALASLPGLKQKAEAGRKHIKKANDWDEIAKQTESLYEEVLAP